MHRHPNKTDVKSPTFLMFESLSVETPNRNFCRLQSRLCAGWLSRYGRTGSHELSKVSKMLQSARRRTASHTSFCALCACNSALSCSTIICSSLYANAQGTPSSSALVLTTQRVLPPMFRPLLNHEVIVLAFEETDRRVLAGIMSCRAMMRS